MAKIFAGRYAARLETPFVVFIIGMRINRILAIRKWTSVARSMGPMLRELYSNPDLGFLHSEFSFTLRSVSLVQYWRSFDHLHAYAHARDAAHLPAWAAFNRSIGNDGTVGIWHETYQIPDNGYECVYANMPRYGLGAAGQHVQAIGQLHSAKGRMGAKNG